MPDTEPCSDFHESGSSDSRFSRQMDFITGFAVVLVLAVLKWLIWG